MSWIAVGIGAAVGAAGGGGGWSLRFWAEIISTVTINALVRSNALNELIFILMNFRVGKYKRNKLLKDEMQMDYLSKLVKNSFRKGYGYIRKFCQEMVKLNSSTIVHSYCKFLKNHIHLIPEEAL